MLSAFEVTAFDELVEIVVRDCPDEEVFWIHTDPIVAAVENPFAFWDWTKMNLVTNSWRSKLAAAMLTLDNTIAGMVYATSPEPTTRRLFDVRPKALSQWPLLALARTCAGAIKALAVKHNMSLDFKGTSTLCALAGDSVAFIHSRTFVATEYVVRAFAWFATYLASVHDYHYSTLEPAISC